MAMALYSFIGLQSAWTGNDEPRCPSLWIPGSTPFRQPLLASVSSHSIRCSGAKPFTEVQLDHASAALPSEVQLDHASAALPSMPFHLAIPVNDIQAARDFYGKVLGCPEGRSAKTWVDFSLYGHQLVCHCVPNYNAESSANSVDGDAVPVPHFGLAMSVPEFLELADRVRAGGVQFIIEPHIRFKGQPGEQWTMFFKDKSGNSLEFKAMTNSNNLFAKYVVVD